MQGRSHRPLPTQGPRSGNHLKLRCTIYLVGHRPSRTSACLRTHCRPNQGTSLLMPQQELSHEFPSSRRPFSLESTREEAGCQLHRDPANGTRLTLQRLATRNAAGLMAARAKYDLRHQASTALSCAVWGRGSAFLSIELGWGIPTQTPASAHIS